MSKAPVSKFKVTHSEFPYCTVEHLAQYSPSIELLSYQYELQYRSLVCTICIDVCRLMQYSVRVACTATRLIQLYYLRHKIVLANTTPTPHRHSTDPHELCIDQISMSSIELICASILLSSKVQYQPRKLTDYLTLYITTLQSLYHTYTVQHNHSLNDMYHIICKYMNNYNNEMNNFRDTVVSTELLLYCTVEYNIEYDSIVEYTLILLKQLLYDQYESIHRLQHKSMQNYIHDIYKLCILSLQSTVYLHYRTQAISVALIYCIDQLYSDINIQSITHNTHFIYNAPTWYETCDVYADDIICIINLIVEVCDNNDELIQQIRSILPQIIQSLQQQRHTQNNNHSSQQHHKHDRHGRSTNSRSMSHNRSTVSPYNRDNRDVRTDHKSPHHSSPYQRDRHYDDRQYYNEPYYNEHLPPARHHRDDVPHNVDRRHDDHRSRIEHTSRQHRPNRSTQHNNQTLHKRSYEDASFAQPPRSQPPPQSQPPQRNKSHHNGQPNRSPVYNRPPPTNQYSGPPIDRLQHTPLHKRPSIDNARNQYTDEFGRQQSRR